MNVLSKEMNVFHTYIHFGLCTTLPDRPSLSCRVVTKNSAELRSTCLSYLHTKRVVISINACLVLMPGFTKLPLLLFSGVAEGIPPGIP